MVLFFSFEVKVTLKITLKVTIALALEQVWKLHYILKKECKKLNFSGMMPYDPQNMKSQNTQKNSWS